MGGDLVVHRLGIGTNRITGPGFWGEPADRQGAVALLRRALRLGVTLIDTADSYGPGVSESLIADALHPYPEDLLIVTKGGYVRPGPGQWRPNGRPEHLRAALEGSLRRLRLQQIRLYLFHEVDPEVPIEESVGVLAEMQAEGKIHHIGVSNVDITQLRRAQAVTQIVVVQNRYNLMNRASDDLVEICEREGLGFMIWDPLATGSLARSEGLIRQIALHHGATCAQIALASLLHRSPVMLPIPGTSTVTHLEENLQATQIRLSAEEYDLLDHLPRTH